MQGELLFYVEAQPWARAYGLHLSLRLHGRHTVATNITLEHIPEGQAAGPALSMTPEQAAGLMDALWRAGVRPTEEGGPGQLKATERHLEDMRRIAFGTLVLKEG